MSKRTEYLKALFAGRNLAQDATALNIDLSYLQVLTGDPTLIVEGTVIIDKIETPLAAAMGKLTSSDPRNILLAQAEDELDATGAGYARDKKLEVGKPVKVKEKKVKAQPAGARGAFGGVSRFKLD
jgi:hypothetical protein